MSHEAYLEKQSENIIKTCSHLTKKKLWRVKSQKMQTPESLYVLWFQIPYLHT